MIEQMSLTLSRCPTPAAEADRWSSCGDDSGPGRSCWPGLAAWSSWPACSSCEAADGAERGVRLLRFATGAGFDFEVLVDRGFDIGRAFLGGRPLAWWSPVGLTGPWYYEPAGIGWFRGFPGGLVSTCGLDHTLLGGTDDSSVFNYPHRQTETYGLHGRYTGLPARLAGYGTRWDGDDCVLYAEAEVAQVAVFGEQLLLSRRIEADLGGTSVRLTDTVTNTGPTACPHMMLYHCNIGFPVVDDTRRAELPGPAGHLRQRRTHRRLPRARRTRAARSSRSATSTTWRRAPTATSGPPC